MSLFNAAGASWAGGGGLHAVWPQLRGVSAFGTGTGAASATVPSPQSGDLVLAWVTIAGDSTATVTAPAGEGWTVEQRAASAAGAGHVTTLCWKYWGHGSTDNSTPSFASSNGTSTVGLVLETWKNVRQASPINTTTTANGSGGTTASPADATNSAPERVSVSCSVAGLTTAGNISAINGPLYVQTAAGASYATTSGPDQAIGLARDENITLNTNVGANGVVATFTAANTAWSSITAILRGP